MTEPELVIAAVDKVAGATEMERAALAVAFMAACDQQMALYPDANDAPPEVVDFMKDVMQTYHELVGA